MIRPSQLISSLFAWVARGLLQGRVHVLDDVVLGLQPRSKESHFRWEGGTKWWAGLRGLWVGFQGQGRGIASRGGLVWTLTG